MPSIAQPTRPQGLAPMGALLLLALIWGASFLFIKVGLQAMTPEVLVLIRTLSGALALAAILTVLRRSPRAGFRRRLLPLTVMAFFSSALPWIAISWGELYIDSGLTSILNATTPLWTAIFAFWVTPSERPSALNYLGVAIGFAGALILVAPELAAHGLKGSGLGALAVLVGSASYAVAALYQRRRLAGVDPLEASLGQMALASLLVAPLAFPTLHEFRLSAAPLAAALALGIGGSGLAYVLYYYLLNSLGATRASTVTFLLPITAVFWGALLLHEAITLPILAGMAVVLAGIFLTSRKVRRPVRRSADATASP